MCCQILYSFLSQVLFFISKNNVVFEKDELVKARQQSEARLGMEITSLKENLHGGRKELESKEKKLKEANQMNVRLEKEKDDLRGDIAGKVLKVPFY